MDYQAKPKSIIYCDLFAISIRQAINILTKMTTVNIVNNIK